MDGKTPILSRLVILLLLFILSVNTYSDTDYSPGEVVFISLDENESSMNFYYNNNLTTKVLKNNKPYLLFGVPYYTKEGKNQFVFNGEKINKTVTLNISRKKYPIQRIEIKKFKTKTEDEYKRIAKERSLMIKAKKQTYNKFPDYMFTMPAVGPTSGTYGTVRYYNGKKGNYHNGYDIAADLGAPVYAPSSGIVTLTGDYYYNGKFIMVNHGNNLISLFLHLDEIAVKKNDIIKKGQVIGAIGSTGLSTGPHLHWSVMLNNSYINPLELVNN
jgi:murein DD-endopeptidase MepM/ murein hydrolase activator NlpD